MAEVSTSCQPRPPNTLFTSSPSSSCLQEHDGPQLIDGSQVNPVNTIPTLDEREYPQVNPPYIPLPIIYPSPY